MKTEKRIYVIDVEDPSIESVPDLTDEQFMTIAEDSGRVYTLEGFMRAFNIADELSTAVDYVRMIEVPLSPNIDTEPHMGLINKVELASDLAHDRMRIEIGVGIESDDDDPRVVMVVRGGRVYTEQAQKVFNKWFDYYSTKITNVEV